MIDNERIIVSMTSYPGRITNVGKAIYFLLTKQTVKPDEIHLWLAEPEFPNREKDLPDDLAVMLNHNKVFLHWLPKNTYSHKRHEIFHIANEEDCIFIFDDDCFYANNLIETVMKVHEQQPNAVISYNRASCHIYQGKHILYPVSPLGGPYVNVGRINGNSMFPFKVMPKAVYEKGYYDTRDKCTPICDESWIMPWLVYFDVPIIWLNFGWGTQISKEINMWNGLAPMTHQYEANGLERRDNWLANVLDAFPKIKEKYEKLFNYGK
jgi:hypothetical protein